ncbi:MAG: hypothetical protein K6B14_02940 [Lachnospiraceae bacterium]|nr:hypothetical protein [Lachnospiraceae bacterium]
MEIKKKKPMDMSDHELLAELVEQGRQEALVRNVGIVIRVAILIAIIIIAAIIVPKIIDAYHQIQQVASEIEGMVADMKTRIDTVTDAGNNVITDLQDSVDKFTEMVNSFNPMNLFNRRS